VLFSECHIFILAKWTIPRELFIVSELTKINSACANGKVWMIYDSGRSVKAPGRGLGRLSHKIP
jgi:hypothetical protein